MRETVVPNHILQPEAQVSVIRGFPEVRCLGADGDKDTLDQYRTQEGDLSGWFVAKVHILRSGSRLIDIIKGWLSAEEPLRCNTRAYAEATHCFWLTKSK